MDETQDVMHQSKDPTTQSAATRPSISPAQVFELWGDGPIFPGPAWRLSWPLDAADQQGLNVALRSGQLWDILRSRLPELAELPELQSWLDQRDVQPGTQPLHAIASLADALLQPASLEVCQPFVPLTLRTPCLVVRSDQHELAGRLLKLSAQLVAAASIGKAVAPLRFASLRQALIDLMEKVQICCAHPLTAAQLAEARRRGIPSYLIDPTQQLYQLGTGLHSRWISSTSNDRDSAFGVVIAASKRRSLELLKQLGLPVPRERRIPHHGSDQQLLAAAAELGYPCVIKPQDGEQGLGVTAAIATEQELLAAAMKAKQCTQRALLLQEHIEGDDFRLNVINGRLAFVVKRTPPVVVGNGVDSIADLVEHENTIRRRLKQEGRIAGEIDLADSEVMRYVQKAGFELASVPPAGYRVRLRGNANITTGGRREELDPALVHPWIQRQCVAIARTFRLDCCGIDYITTDITRAPSAGVGAYIEVNAKPQNGANRASMLLDNLFPGDQPHSIPITIIIADWQYPLIPELESALAELGESFPAATIGIPVELYSRIAPFIQDRDRSRIALYRHPRELLVDHANCAVLYLLSPELVLQRGLPASNSATVLCGLSDDLRDSADGLSPFFKSYDRLGREATAS